MLEDDGGEQEVVGNIPLLASSKFKDNKLFI
jgi:hypothetical protein